VRQYAHDRLLKVVGKEITREAPRRLPAVSLEGEKHFRAPGGPEWLDRMEMELGNLHSALEWALASSVETRDCAWRARSLCSGIFAAAGFEGIQWLERLLDADSAGEQTGSVEHSIIAGALWLSPQT